MSDSFSVDISCDGDWLHSKIILTSDFKVQPEYFFNVIMNDKIIHRSGWTAENSHSFNLKVYGEYKIQGHIRYEEEKYLEKVSRDNVLRTANQVY